MLSKIVRIEPRPNHHLFVELKDGRAAELDLGGWSHWGPVFKPLEDPTFFAKVVLDDDFHSPTWPNGADICPDLIETMVDEALKKRTS